jgi:hypothetical protein
MAVAMEIDNFAQEALNSEQQRHEAIHLRLHGVDEKYRDEDDQVLVPAITTDVLSDPRYSRTRHPWSFAIRDILHLVRMTTEGTPDTVVEYMVNHPSVFAAFVTTLAKSRVAWIKEVTKISTIDPTADSVVMSTPWRLCSHNGSITVVVDSHSWNTLIRQPDMAQFRVVHRIETTKTHTLSSATIDRWCEHGDVMVSSIGLALNAVLDCIRRPRDDTGTVTVLTHLLKNRDKLEVEHKSAPVEWIGKRLVQTNAPEGTYGMLEYDRSVPWLDYVLSMRRYPPPGVRIKDSVLGRTGYIDQPGVALNLIIPAELPKDDDAGAAEEAAGALPVLQAEKVKVEREKREAVLANTHKVRRDKQRKQEDERRATQLRLKEQQQVRDNLLRGIRPDIEMEDDEKHDDDEIALEISEAELEEIIREDSIKAADRAEKVYERKKRERAIAIKEAAEARQKAEQARLDDKEAKETNFQRWIIREEVCDLKSKHVFSTDPLTDEVFFDASKIGLKLSVVYPYDFQLNGVTLMYPLSTTKSAAADQFAVLHVATMPMERMWEYPGAPALVAYSEGKKYPVRFGPKTR